MVARALASTAAAGVAVVAQADYQHTITLGSLIIGAVLGLVGLAVLMYGARWKAAYTVASTQAAELRNALQDERGRADRCQELLAEANARGLDLQSTIARLESLPNLSILVDKMAEESQRTHDRAIELATLAEENAKLRLASALADVRELIEDHTEKIIQALVADARVDRRTD